MTQVALLVAALVMAGCATYTSGPTVATPAKDLPRTIAVLPFVPLPEKEEQTRVLGRMIAGALSATPYDVIKPHVVEERLVRAGLADPKAAAAKDARELAAILRVDGILYGELTHWDRFFALAYAQVAAGAHVKLVDARNGNVVFDRAEVWRSHEGGVPTNPMSAAIQVLQSALKLREIEIVRACDNVVRNLLKEIPTPPVLAARRPPALTNVLSDGAGRVLKAGEIVTVIANGQAGMIGSFDLLPITKNLKLEETTEGVYVGRYAVKPGENATDAYVVARLSDPAGRSNEWEDVLGRFIVDTLPPATPVGITVSLRDGELVVAWTPNAEADLAGYGVYRSDSALTGFKKVASTEKPDHHQPAEAATYFRVTAVDRAGNESAPSSSVGLPILGSALGGKIGSESYLVPANSPYVVQASVTIEDGATLHVLPGVVVRFAPGAEGIIVQNGRLVARGTTEKPVAFQSASDRPGAGDYRTAVLVHAKTGQTSVLEGASVEHAAIGVKVESGALEALRVRITGNLQSGVEVSDTGTLKLSESVIGGHGSGTAIAIKGFGRAVLRGNSITGNGWAIVNYSGNQVDARENWWGSAKPIDALFVGDVDLRDALVRDARTPK